MTYHKKCGLTLIITLLASCSVQNEQRNPFLNIANEALISGNTETALGFYDKAIKANPHNIQARIGRTEALINLGYLDLAMDEANTGLKISPEAEGLLYAKGKIYLLKGNTNLAGKIFEKLSHYPKALNALGTIHDAEFNSEKARNYYRQAIAIDDHYADAYGNLGLSLALSTDRIQEAIDCLEKANMMSGNSSTQKNNLALAYGIAGNFERALAIYEEDSTFTEARLKIEQLKKIIAEKKH